MSSFLTHSLSSSKSDGLAKENTIKQAEMAPEKWILVTGASGYLAGHIIQQLLAKGYNVRGTIRNKVEG